MVQNSFSSLTMAELVNNIHPISAEVRQYINRTTTEYRLKKGEILIAPGTMCTRLYLIRQGAVRAYVKEGGQEITIWVCAEGELVTSIRGFFSRLPVTETVEVIEDSVLITAEYDDMQRMYDRYPETNIAVRKILERYYQDAEERAIIARMPRAESKYAYFVAHKGYLLNRIPLKYIASYLGMTLETLSRIRSRISRHK